MEFTLSLVLLLITSFLSTREQYVDARQIKNQVAGSRMIRPRESPAGTDFRYRKRSRIHMVSRLLY